MRRNLAPSRRPGFAAPFMSRPQPKQQEDCTKSTEDDDRRYFNVVWCKQSTRKHKKWEGDGVLILRPSSRLAILKDPQGKDIGRESSMPMSKLMSAECGSMLSFAGKQVEIMDEISSAQYKKAEDKEEIEVDERPQIVTPVVPKFKPFAIPARIGLGTVFEHAKPSNKPMFDPEAQDVLVMPKPPCTLENKDSLVDVVVDPHLYRQLRPHQRDGVTFLYQCVMGLRQSDNYGAILADEMGLGKTLQSITLIWTLLKQGPWSGKPVVKRVLILAPSSLVKNWQAEFNKWLGSERIQVYAVDASTRVGEYVKRPHQPVLIMSYEMFTRSYDDLLSHLHFDLIVCDEGHRLKNNQVKASQTLAQMTTDRRVVLTGTPLQNDLKEFYAIVNVVSPGALGSPAQFARNFEEPIVRSKQPEATAEEVELGSERTEEMGQLTGQFILRRTQDILSRYLPPKVEYVLFTPPSALQVHLYQSTLEGFGDYLNGDSKCILASIMQLRKVCNHPSLAGDFQVPPELESLTYEEQGSKLAVVSGLLWSLRETSPGEKIVLVSISTQVLDVLQELCQHYNYPWLRLDGSTSTEQRQHVVTRFNSPYSQDFVLLLSSKAGGTGLNLIGASRILLYDMDWNPAHDLQAMARVWRDGQKKRVHIYRLVTAGTVEEKIFQRQTTKQGLGGGVMEAAVASNKFHFSSDDLKDLFTFNGEAKCDTHTLLACSCDGSGSNLSHNKENMEAMNKKDMRDLLGWQHIDPSTATPYLEADDPVLSRCVNYLSFMFRNEAYNNTL